MTYALLRSAAALVLALNSVACAGPGAADNPLPPELAAPPRGLNPLLPVPRDNPLTAEAAALGEQLFFDTRLSSDGTLACASCHDPALAFSDGRRLAVGTAGRTGRRNAPSLLNRAYLDTLFWDGRVDSLEAQALLPMTSPSELGNTHEEVVRRIESVEAYAPAFEHAFGSDVITIERIAMAIASFERTLLSGDSAYDRYVLDRDDDALTAGARRGLAVFTGRGRCTFCHEGRMFTDQRFHNTGVSWLASANPAARDLGRYELTGRDVDRGAFRTPSLRDIELTAPYMHDGSLPTLVSVVNFYDRGGQANPWIDSMLQELNLTSQEKADLIEFLKALTGRDSPARIAFPNLEIQHDD